MSDWLTHVYNTNPIAHAIGMLALVAMTGMALGGIRIRGVGLGVAGVLFTGILAGHLGQAIDRHVLEFVKEFGLILFIFTIGLQLGPGFFSSLRRQGLALNLSAFAVVSINVLVAIVAVRWMGLDSALLPGLLSGATTNTPSLAAGQQALAALPGVSADRAALPALAYAVAYPVGIMSIIAAMLLLRVLLRIDPRAEARLAQQVAAPIARLERRTLIVTNAQLAGRKIAEIPGRANLGVVISRIRTADDTEVRPAADTTELHLGDRLLAVGRAEALDELERIIGIKGDDNLLDAPGDVTSRRIIVTHRQALGRTLAELRIERDHGVVVSRIARADVDMTASPRIRLQFGDVLRVVGTDAALTTVSAILGNSVRALNETHFVPLFAGVLVGTLAGLAPISFPGLPVPFRLGLAGGPLIVALIVGRIGRIGPLVWHMPANAGAAFRDLGIALFLSSVGLMAGTRFFEVVLSPAGAWWLLAALCIGMAPLLLVGFAARVWLKLDYAALTGLLAGSTTDPPALAFANSLAGSDAPAMAYATVYPLTMVLRIISVQVVVILCCA